jgi:exodeoxyribonuclease-3
VPTPFAVTTWNVNSVRSRLEHVLKFLREDYPDVLCLQELKVTDADFPLEEFGRRGYRAAVYGQKTYNGVAIVSPYDLEDVVTGFADGDKEDPEARVIAATVRGVRVVNVYVPNGQEVGSDKYAYKLGWMARLEQLLGRSDPKRPLLLAGDFNVAMDDRDVHDPKAWEGRVLFSEPEREAAGRWLTWGLSDAFRKHHEEDGVYSWWDYRQGAFAGNRGLRIDHLWVTRPLLKRCESCDVVKGPRTWDKPSDHAPVTARFRS